MFNTVLVDAAKKRLENLGYFEKVEADATDTLVPDRKDLDVQVIEKRTGSLSIGAGFSSIDSLVGQIELTQANFDITISRISPAVASGSAPRSSTASPARISWCR